MSKVSVIIPVYNTAPYLRECVESVTLQDHADLEAILVDDGSTDESGGLCDELASADSRLQVIHQPNQGLSMARNNGLHRATGDLVLFLDSDDYWLERDTVSRLVEEMKRHPECDFIGFNWLYCYPDGTSRRWINFADHVAGEVSGEEALRGILRTGGTPMSACIKIVRRAFLIDKEISFIPGITSEDIPWFMELLVKARKCLFLPDYLYGYRRSVSGSITEDYTRRRFRDLVFIIEEGIRKASSVTTPVMRDALLSFYATEYCILLSHLDVLSKEEREEMKAWLTAHRYLLRYDLSPKVRLASRVARLLGLRALISLLQLRNRLSTK